MTTGSFFDSFKTVRQLTTEYAMMLSGIVKNVTESFTFTNFDMLYIDYPIGISNRKLGVY